MFGVEDFPWLKEHPLSEDPKEWADFLAKFTSKSINETIDLFATHTWYKNGHPFYEQIQSGVIFDPNELKNVPHMPIPVMDLSEDDIHNLFSLASMYPLGLDISFDVKSCGRDSFFVPSQYQYLDSLIKKIMFYDISFNPFFNSQKVSFRAIQMGSLDNDAEISNIHTDFNYSPGENGYINHRYLFATSFPTEFFLFGEKDTLGTGFDVSSSDNARSGMPGCVYLQTDHQAHRAPDFCYPKDSGYSRILVNVTFFTEKECCDVSDYGVVKYKDEFLP